MSLEHLDAEGGVALDAVVRRNGAHDLLHPGDHAPEIDARFGCLQPEPSGVAHLVREPRAADQRLARHAAGVEAVPAHAPRLDQRDARLHRGADVGADQPRRPGADHHEVALEAARARPFRPGTARLQRREHAPGDQREHAQQREGQQQRGRDDVGQRLYARELRARVHVHQRGAEHRELAHPVEGARPYRREPHHQVDQEERQRQQPQREQVERTVARKALVDGARPRAEAPLHRVAQQVARGKERERRTDAGGEGHQQRAPRQAEQRPARERHYRRAGKGHRGDQHVEQEIAARDQRPRVLQQQREFGAAGLDALERQHAVEVEGEQQREQQREQRQQSGLPDVHARAPLVPQQDVLCPIARGAGGTGAGFMQRYRAGGCIL